MALFSERSLISAPKTRKWNFSHDVQGLAKQLLFFLGC